MFPSYSAATKSGAHLPGELPALTSGSLRRSAPLLMHSTHELVSEIRTDRMRDRIRQLFSRIRKYKHLIHSSVKFCTCIHRRANPTLSSVGSNVANWKEHFLPRRKMKVRWKSEISLRGASRGMQDSRETGRLIPGAAGDAKFGCRWSFVAG